MTRRARLTKTDAMQIRPATIEDAKRLFEWRNDPLTRAMSVNTDPVEWGGHARWLEARLSREAPNLFIAEVEGLPVGTFRIDGDEISYTVAPDYRGRGHASQMLVLAFERFGGLRAEIKPDNSASIAAATKAGHRVALI